MRLIVPAIIALILATSCSHSSRNVIPQEQMARLMADLSYADAMIGSQYQSTYSSDSLRKLLKQSVLAKHGVSQSELDSAMIWYGHNLPAYMELCDRADSIISDSLKALDALEAAIAEAAGLRHDLVNIWPGTPAHLFSQRMPGDFITFAVEADSSWRKGDVFTWSMTLLNNRSPLSLSMTVEYADAPGYIETISADNLIDEQRHLLELRTDSNKMPARIYGYAHLKAQPQEQAYTDSIMLARTPNTTTGYYRLRRMIRKFPSRP